MNIKIFFLASSVFSKWNEGEKTYIIKYNATPKNGKPFVINEILARLYTFPRCRVRVGLVEENVISPRYDMMIFSYFYCQPPSSALEKHHQL